MEEIKLKSRHKSTFMLRSDTKSVPSIPQRLVRILTILSVCPKSTAPDPFDPISSSTGIGPIRSHSFLLYSLSNIFRPFILDCRTARYSHNSRRIHCLLLSWVFIVSLPFFASMGTTHGQKEKGSGRCRARCPYHIRLAMGGGMGRKTVTW